MNTKECITASMGVVLSSFVCVNAANAILMTCNFAVDYSISGSPWGLAGSLGVGESVKTSGSADAYALLKTDTRSVDVAGVIHTSYDNCLIAGRPPIAGISTDGDLDYLGDTNGEFSASVSGTAVASYGDSHIISDGHFLQQNSAFRSVLNIPIEGGGKKTLSNRASVFKRSVGAFNRSSSLRRTSGNFNRTPSLRRFSGDVNRTSSFKRSSDNVQSRHSRIVSAGSVVLPNQAIQVLSKSAPDHRAYPFVRAPKASNSDKVKKVKEADTLGLSTADSVDPMTQADLAQEDIFTTDSIDGLLVHENPDTNEIIETFFYIYALELYSLATSVLPAGAWEFILFDIDLTDRVNDEIDSRVRSVFNYFVSEYSPGLHSFDQPDETLTQDSNAVSKARSPSNINAAATTPVSEPASLALMVVGLSALSFMRRRLYFHPSSC